MDNLPRNVHRETRRMALSHRVAAPMAAAALAAVLIMGAALATGQEAATDMTGKLPVPGHYEVTTNTTYKDVPMPDTSITTQNCLTREDLEKDPASVFAALPEGKTCDVGEFTMADGAISMRMVCSTPEGDMVMDTTGHYDEDGYDMITDVTIKVGEQEVEMRSVIEGKLMGDC